MDETRVAWPTEQRELQSAKFDSAVWNDFTFRDDDVVIATYEKAGTTWVQQIVAQLIFQGETGVDVPTISPWLDMRLPPASEKLTMLKAQRHRRFLKTHLPVDALVYSPRAKYLYVGRDGRDVAWSLYNHLTSYTDAYLDQLNALPGWDGPPLRRPDGPARAFFFEWMTRDGWPIGPFWDHVRGWWAIRDLPNLMLLHYAALKADLPGEIRRIAEFLRIKVDPQHWPAIIEHCSFGFMKAHAADFAPRRGSGFAGGADSFIHKGTNGRWRDVLSEAECGWYDDVAGRQLGQDCARWLQGGAVRA